MPGGTNSVSSSPAPGVARTFRLAAAAVVAAVLVLGMLFLWRPTAFFDIGDRLTMWRHDIRPGDVMVGPYKLHYLASGQGRPLVLVHGLGDSSASWLKSIPDYTRRGYRVYAPDLLGFGASDTPDIDYAVPRQASVLRQFMDAMGIRQADIIGISMGGWTSALLAEHSPERVRRLVLLDSAGMRMPEAEARRAAASLIPRTPGDLARMMAAVTVNPEPIPGFIARDLLRRMHEREWVVRRALDTMLTGADVLDGTLGAVKAPVLLVWGREDVLTPLWTGEAMHREMPQSELVVLPGCGHIAAYACRDRVVPEVAAFLAR